MRASTMAAAAVLLALCAGNPQTALATMVHHIPKSFDLDALKLPSSAPRGAREIECLAQAIYHEARGEPLMGRIAVAQVIVNRVKSRSYPDTICKVVYQNAHLRHRCQFSFACDGVSDRPREREPWLEARLLAEEIVCAQDCAQAQRVPQIGMLAEPLRTATHYHAAYVMPRWGRKKQRVGRVGRHIFYTSPRVTGRM